MPRRGHPVLRARAPVSEFALRAATAAQATPVSPHTEASAARSANGRPSAGRLQAASEKNASHTAITGVRATTVLSPLSQPGAAPRAEEPGDAQRPCLASRRYRSGDGGKASQQRHRDGGRCGSPGDRPRHRNGEQRDLAESQSRRPPTSPARATPPQRSSSSPSPG